MKSPLRKVAIAVIACIVTGGILFSCLYNEHRIYFRSIPRGYESEAAFFRLLQWPKPPDDMFNPDDAPHWELNELKKFIPPEGIKFSDVNHEMEGTAGQEQILQSLRTRKGKPFTSFSHLSHIYSVPYKQYSELTFKTDSKGQTVVNVAEWYTLTFRRDGKQPVIVQWDYNQIEGD